MTVETMKILIIDSLFFMRLFNGLGHLTCNGSMMSITHWIICLGLFLELFR